MRESALWTTFSKCVPLGGMAVRIENSVSSGMPDVLMTYGGRTVLVELKTDSEISKKQGDWARLWAMAGGTSWFLIKTNQLLYLVPGAIFLWNGKWDDKKWRIKNCREAMKKIWT